MKIPYYPGCTLNTVAKDFDTSAKVSAGALGLELKEMDQWNCCGAVFPLTPDNLMGLAAPAKVLNNAAKEGDVVTTLCSFCFNVLKRTKKALEDQEKRDIVYDMLEEDCRDGVEVLHFIELIKKRVGFDTLKTKVVKDLQGIKLAPYYGCMLLRPYEEAAIDDHESPHIFEDLLSSIGVEPIDFPGKINCCGAHLTVSEEEIVVKMSGRVLISARKRGAEAVVTSCPLCLYNLDRGQKGAVKEDPAYKEIPVLYFTQVLGLALGQEASVLGLDKNVYDPRPLLNEKGII
ncbi:MAG: CoB--CoM heterodisulfide reductase iron-sulfur subunit B family protein [Thermodesulfobacteriota bacterium]